MEEKMTMDDFAAELDASFRKISEGDSLTGTVIDVNEERVLLDLKYYTEGIIPKKEFTENPYCLLKDEVEIGSEVTATVLSTDDGKGRILLSRLSSEALEVWDQLELYRKEKTALTVKIEEAVKGGAICFIEGVRAFIPSSKLSLDYVEDAGEWIGKTISVRVITADREEKRLVASAKELLREQEKEAAAKKIRSVPVGLVTEGTVESLQNYGAFVVLENGATGFLHISQISEKRIKHPSVALKVGQTVKVKVTAVKDGRLSLSMKALNEVAVEEVPEETFELPESEDLSFSLGSLLSGLKF